MCTSPLHAFQYPNGSVKFGESHRVLGAVPLDLPCGQCMECRLERSRQWAVRCMHEASLWKFNSFITLTYSESNLPADNNLFYPHYQLFMKRLLKRFHSCKSNPIRFYMCGEYGSVTNRPHYHAIIFNLDLPDKVYHKVSGSGKPIYRSEILDKLWGLGHCYIGDVTFESAAYVARYIVDKLSGKAIEHLSDGRVVDLATGEIYVPEFTKMSNRPGIGAGFYRKYYGDIFPHDRVVSRGTVVSVPRYYSKLLERDNPELLAELKIRRKARIKVEEQSDDRCRQRDIVNRARLSKLVRQEV